MSPRYRYTVPTKLASLSGVLSVTGSHLCMTFRTKRLSIAVPLCLGLSLTACGGGSGIPPSFYVDVVRSLAPAANTVGTVPQDPVVQLRSWAEEGDAESQYRLGGLAYIRESRDEGWIWMCMAAAQGHAAAMSKLGYWSEHLDADPIRGLAWYKRATLRGHLFANKYNERLARSMTPEQIAATQQVIAGAAPDGCDREVKPQAHKPGSN